MNTVISKSAENIADDGGKDQEIPLPATDLQDQREPDLEKNPEMDDGPQDSSITLARPDFGTKAPQIAKGLDQTIDQGLGMGA